MSSFFFLLYTNTNDDNCCHGKNANHNPKSVPMFLRVGCIDWLLSYADDQLHFQGVDNLVGHMDGVLEANCAAVAGLHVEWDFHLKEWQAQFVSGPFQGVKREFGIESLIAFLARIQRHIAVDALSLNSVGVADNCRLRDQLMRDQGALNFCCPQAVA